MTPRPPGAWPKGQPPDYVHRYVDWLVSLERVPPSKQKWADENGFAVETLYDWDHDDRVKKLISDAADKLNMSPERIQQVMNSLFKAALNDVNAAKVYMAHVDKIMPRKPSDESSLEDMSNEELEAELAKHGLVRAPSG